MSDNPTILIIGCGAGGGTAAQFARKTNRKANIIVFEKGMYPQYSKCGLPYTISKDIPNINDLIEFNTDWFKKAKIDLKLNTPVENINIKSKTVQTQNNDNMKEQYQFDSLILATGAIPFIPPIKNIQTKKSLLKGVFSVRTIDDVKNISSFVKKGKKAIVIGAGFIGLEMADCLWKKGMKVTVIEMLPRVLPQIFDDDFSKQVQKHLEQYLTIFLHHSVIEIRSKENTVSNVLIEEATSKETQEIPADLVILATGTRPEIQLAKSIDCSIGEHGGIIVNNKAMTSQQMIYAVGDCTEYPDFITKKHVPVGLGSIAVRQAIAAGANAAGGDYSLPDGVLQTCTSTFFDLEVGSVGPCTKQFQDQEIIIGKHNGSSLPEYYPGGKPISIKTIIDQSTGTILAAKAIGANAAQRINTYATAILSELNVETFRKLETAYAPPIAPTLDTVTIAADIAAMKYKRKHPRH